METAPSVSQAPPPTSASSPSTVPPAISTANRFDGLVDEAANMETVQVSDAASTLPSQPTISQVIKEGVRDIRRGTNRRVRTIIIQ